MFVRVATRHRRSVRFLRAWLNSGRHLRRAPPTAVTYARPAHLRLGPRLQSRANQHDGGPRHLRRVHRKLRPGLPTAAPVSKAIKVGIASGSGRVRGHVGRGYEIVTQWQNLEHDQAASIERQTIAYWRAHGWPQVDATPKDGRTETLSSDHLPETLAWLARLLEVEPVATEEPGMPEGRKDGW